VFVHVRARSLLLIAEFWQVLVVRNPNSGVHSQP
jgi:hypothetical protein